MTRLGQRIVELIKTLGPMPVHEYMATCLFDPQDGYYTTREPFGEAGDFITAPEISQMFGELIAIGLHSAWTSLGRPDAVTIAEIGPGRGTLMKDMLRTLSRIEPELVASATFALIEISPRLKQIQAATLAGAGARIEWHETIATLAQSPLLIVGNEIFDAIPVRQFVKTDSGWRERMVGVDDADALSFMAGLATLDASLLPPDAPTAPIGSIVEFAPARTAVMAGIAEHIRSNRGAGIFIDYGHLEPGVGDTLQALRKHAYEPVFASPGEADLTSHVDFSALAATVRSAGLAAHLTTQGEFLLALGLLERAGRLGADGDHAARERLAAQVERLAGPEAMGKLFKVLAILPRGVAFQPFHRAD